MLAAVQVLVDVQSLSMQKKNKTNKHTWIVLQISKASVTTSVSGSSVSGLVSRQLDHRFRVYVNTPGAPTGTKHEGSKVAGLIPHLVPEKTDVW